MKDKKSKKVVIIHDIDSKSIEKAILILRGGGVNTPAPVGYHIVQEAQQIIDDYSKTMEKTQGRISRKEEQARRSERRSGVVKRTLCVLGAMAGFCAFGYWLLTAASQILEKF